jgi:phosphatidylserine decarboxylase
MKARSALLRILQQEDINFLLTNRLPRRWATRFMGWFSRIEHPWIRDSSLAAWRFFGDLDLSDARETSFPSMHACFIRELKPGSRPPDPDQQVLASPCDAIVGASGRVRSGLVFQAKGFPYGLSDLLHDPELEALYEDGAYVTLRLRSSMYHRFHAPHDCRVTQVTYVAGDTWNVNPIALQRVERLFCKNERAVVRTRLAGSGHLVTLVPVAAILVASIRLRGLATPLTLTYRGPNKIAFDATFSKGDEMGWFEHGSTIIVFAPPGFALCEGIEHGRQIRAGQALMRLP